MKRLFAMLTQLSSNKILSKLTGIFAKSSWSQWLIPYFAKIYRINLDEAEKDIKHYPSLNAFFTRRLREGARPIDGSDETVVSPVDAIITGMGKIGEGTLFHVKGQAYTLKEMLLDDEEVQKYKQGTFIVLYLSPTDYHRIHVPISGEIVKKVHLKGKVYPVNDLGLTYMKRVLSRNERLITYLKNEKHELAVVKVGAMNVASIQYSDKRVSNQVQKGDELAYFEFGSTVVLFMPESSIQFEAELKEGSQVRMGQSIAKLTKYEG